MSNEHKMGEQKLLLYFVFLCVIGASVDAMLGEEDETEGFIHCVHEMNEQVSITSGCMLSCCEITVTHFLLCFV